MKNDMPFTKKERDQFHLDFLKAAAKRAAAEDLLQAAKYALADLEGVMPEFDPDEYHPGWQTIGDLKKAIAKAEGGE